MRQAREPALTTAGGPLLERDPQLTALASYWSDACAGNGRLVFLGGEAGSGKTALSQEFGRRIASRARFLGGTSDAGSTPRPLGPLLDVADHLGVSAFPGDRDVQRGSLFPRVRAALGRTPTLLLFEDMHWSDGATLDLLHYLGRRMDGLTALLLVTFRDDEVVGTHTVAALMGALATTAQVRRLELPLLTVQAVTTLAKATGRNMMRPRCTTTPTAIPSS